MRAIVIPVNPAEPVKEVELPDDLSTRLTEMQKIVGGWVESVVCRGYDGAIAWVNDEGFIKGLPRNARATDHFYPYPPHYLAGDVLVAGCNRLGEDVPLPEQWTAATFEQAPERRTA